MHNLAQIVAYHHTYVYVFISSVGWRVGFNGITLEHLSLSPSLSLSPHTAMCKDTQQSKNNNSSNVIVAASVLLIQYVFSQCSFFACICLLLSLHIWPELFAFVFVFAFIYFFAFRFFLCLLWIWLLFVFNVYLHPDLFLAHFSWCLFVCLRVCPHMRVCVVQ